MPSRHRLVVLTRTDSGNRAWATYLQTRGAQVYCLPTIETAPLPLTAHTTAILKQLADFDWLILTSATAARCLRTLTEQATLTLPWGNVQVAAVGSQTARTLRRAGLTVTFQPSKPNSAALGLELAPVAGRRILWPHTTIYSDELAETLRTRGGIVTAVPLYETRVLDTPDEHFARLLQEGSVGCLTFASPSAVQGFIQRTAGPHLQMARELPAVAIGPVTAGALTRQGFPRVYTSKVPSIAGIVVILQQLDRQGGNDLV